MSAPDPESTAAAEREAWDGVSAAWRKWWRVLEDGAQPVNDRLVELARVQPGHRVLDVAAGLGEPSLTAARRVGAQGSVLGVDLSPGMLAMARERAAEASVTNVELREADAERVELPAESFDAAVSRWGVMLMPEPERAMQNIRGALRPGARLAAAVWGAPERSPVLSLAGRVLQEQFDFPPPDLDAPGPFRLHAPGRLTALFAETGFGDLDEDLVPLSFVFADGDEYVRWAREMSSSLRKRIQDLAGEKREQFWVALERAANECAGADGVVRLPGETICVSGRA